MNFIFGFGSGVIVATIAWYFVLRHNRKKMAEFINVPQEMWDKVESEIDEFGDDVKEKLGKLFGKK